jgi:hypothetical protein
MSVITGRNASGHSVGSYGWSGFYGNALADSVAVTARSSQVQ